MQRDQENHNPVSVPHTKSGDRRKNRDMHLIQYQNLNNETFHMNAYIWAHAYNCNNIALQTTYI